METDTRQVEEKRTRRLGPVLVIGLGVPLVCLPVLAVSQFIAHTRADEYDAWLFAVYGRELLRGGALYADLWDNKPPGIYWINALGLWLGGGSLDGVWALCGAAAAATGAVFFVASRKLYGVATAAISTVLAVVFLNLYPYHVGGNRPSTFFVLAELGCVAWYVAALARGRGSVQLVFAGVCGAVGACFKQSAWGASAAIVLHLGFLIATRRVSPGEGLKRVGWFAAGWVAALGAVTMALWGTSDLQWAWDAIVGFNRMYFAPRAGSALLPEFLWIEPHLRALGLPLILAGAALLYPALRRWLDGAEDRGEQAAQQPAGIRFLLGAWLAIALYLALLGPHRRAMYLGVALPPLMMLAAHGVWLLVRSGGRPRARVVVGVLWLGYMLIWPVQMQVDFALRQYHGRFVEGGDFRKQAVIDAVVEHSRPGDELFVFAYAPDVYWHTGLSPAIRYIGTEKAEQLGEAGAELMDRIVNLLIDTEPDIIIFHQEGYARGTWGPRLRQSGFLDWLAARYERPEDGLPMVWVRRR